MGIDGDGSGIIPKPIVTAAFAADVRADRGRGDAGFRYDIPLCQPALGEARPVLLEPSTEIDRRVRWQDERQTSVVRLKSSVRLRNG